VKQGLEARLIVMATVARPLRAPETAQDRHCARPGMRCRTCIAARGNSVGGRRWHQQSWANGGAGFAQQGCPGGPAEAPTGSGSRALPISGGRSRQRSRPAPAERSSATVPQADRHTGVDGARRELAQVSCAQENGRWAESRCATRESCSRPGARESRELPSPSMIGTAGRADQSPLTAV
jgi:hypothetical protein